MTFFRSKLLAALIFWHLHGTAFAAEEIRFNKGEISRTVRGEITSTIKTWQFRAQQGQRISVALAPTGGDKGTLTLTVYAYCGEEFGKPLVSDAVKWEGPLPCSDRYTIDVAPTPDAIKPARMQRYTLTLTIR